MIENATIARIDLAQPAAADGSIGFVEGSTIWVRCCIDELTSWQKWKVEAAQLDCTNVLFVLDQVLRPYELHEGDRLQVKLDGEIAAEAYVIRRKSHTVKDGGLSHHELLMTRQ